MPSGIAWMWFSIFGTILAGGTVWLITRNNWGMAFAVLFGLLISVTLETMPAFAVWSWILIMVGAPVLKGQIMKGA